MEMQEVVVWEVLLGIEFKQKYLNVSFSPACGDAEIVRS